MNINGTYGIKGEVRAIAWHEDGTVFYEHVEHNQIQNALLNAVADWIATSVASPSSVSSMAIGTGSGQTEADTTLDSMGTWENAQTITGSEGSHWSESQSTPSATAFVSTFTGWAGTVSESGLFGAPSGLAAMYAYDTSISVTLATTDSLQITWTITAA